MSTTVCPLPGLKPGRDIAVKIRFVHKNWPPDSLPTTFTSDTAGRISKHPGENEWGSSEQTEVGKVYYDKPLPPLNPKKITTKWEERVSVWLTLNPDGESYTIAVKLEASEQLYGHGKPQTWTTLYQAETELALPAAGSFTRSGYILADDVGNLGFAQIELSTIPPSTRSGWKRK